MTELMGGESVLGKKVTSQLDYIELVRQGLPYASMVTIATILGIELKAPKHGRSMHGKAQEEARLSPRKSERIVRMAQVTARAIEVFGADEKALVWLKQPNRALRGEAPLDLLDTEIGAQAVKDVLGRIEHGVFS